MEPTAMSIAAHRRSRTTGVRAALSGRSFAGPLLAGRLFAGMVLAGLVLAGCQGYDYDGVADIAGLIDEGDRQAMVKATQSALENNKVGQSANWTNPESGHLGTVTPTRTFHPEPDRNCRDYQQTVTVEGTTAVAFESACREADGSWKIIDSSDPAGVVEYWRPPGYVERYYAPYYDCPSPYYRRYGCGYPYYYYGGPRYYLGYGHRFRY